MAETWKDLIGYQLVFGISGKTVSPETIELFRETGARGIILFRRNFESPDQIKKLISDLENALGYRLLVCVDHEGGRVIMFGGGVTVFPDNYCAGLIGDTELVRRQGEIEGMELRALGVDVNFAPVLDTVSEEYNPGILCRSYGKSFELAAKMGAARIKGMQSAGISATAKHYPGKGHAVVDAHLNLPFIDSTIDEMEQGHLKPFIAAIEAGVDAVMSSHPCYRRIDADVPATFSKKIVGQFLRYKYGYKGVIISDDLEMGAVREVSPLRDAVARSVLAGHDLLLVCHTASAQSGAYNALVKAYEDGTLQKTELEKSVERIKKLSSRRSERFSGAGGPLSEGRKLAAEIAGRTAAVIRKGKTPLPLSGSFIKGKNIAVIFPRFSDISETVMIESKMVNFGNYLSGWFAGAGVSFTPVPVGVKPSDEEAGMALEAVSKCGIAVVFCFDAGLYKGWEKILSGAQKSAPHCIAALLRDPYDLRFLGADVTAVTGYGFRQCQMDAVMKLLLEEGRR